MTSQETSNALFGLQFMDPELPAVKDIMQVLSRQTIGQGNSVGGTLSLARPRVVSGWLQEAFHDANGPFVVDIGCDMGGFARDLARARPDLRVIGLEVKPHQVAFANARAQDEGLQNVVFLQVTVENSANCDVDCWWLWLRDVACFLLLYTICLRVCVYHHCRPTVVPSRLYRLGRSAFEHDYPHSAKIRSVFRAMPMWIWNRFFESFQKKRLVGVVKSESLGTNRGVEPDRRNIGHFSKTFRARRGRARSRQLCLSFFFGPSFSPICPCHTPHIFSDYLDLTVGHGDHQLSRSSPAPWVAAK